MAMSDSTAIIPCFFMCLIPLLYSPLPIESQVLPQVDDLSSLLPTLQVQPRPKMWKVRIAFSWITAVITEPPE